MTFEDVINMIDTDERIEAIIEMELDDNVDLYEELWWNLL